MTDLNPCPAAKEQERMSEREKRLEEALRFVFDQFDRLVNEIYGGEMPCTEEQCARLDQARALTED